MKVLTILGCANRLGARAASQADVVNAVIEARSPAFMYFKHHRRHGSQLVPCSEKLISDRVRLCCDLRLLDPATGRLSRHGAQALQPGRYAKVVTAQTLTFLAEQGFDFSLIQQRVRTAAQSLWLPTSRALYEAATGELRLVEFRRLLNLLAECGHFRVLQSRIYLPANSD